MGNFLKTFGVSMGFFLLLNLIFVFLYAAIGQAVPGATFGQFFGLIGQDLGGFFTAILTVGGKMPDVFNSTAYYLTALADPNKTTVAGHIVAILWVLVPGLVAGILAGKFYSNESSKTAFLGTMLAIFILTVLPIIIVLIPAWVIPSAGPISQALVPGMFYCNLGVSWPLGQYFGVILVGLFNGCFFGGFAAMASSSM